MKTAVTGRYLHVLFSIGEEKDIKDVNPAEPHCMFVLTARFQTN